MATKPRFSRALLFLAVLVLAQVVAPVRADSLGAGNSSSSDPPPPALSFDENGNGFFSFFVSETPVQGVLAPDPSGSGIPIALTYFLAVTGLSPVNNGDVLVSDGTGLSDVIRFTDAEGRLTGRTADRMIYYSITPAGNVETDLADTPFAPINLGSGATAFATETGSEGNNGFVYMALNDLPGIGFYFGTSDALVPVPEPSSLLLFGSGLGILGLYRKKRWWADRFV
jgi:PEP-CTERM motif